jgi:hypothetical protein
VVIISDKFGQLGNRLFLFAHFIANAIEFDYKVCYPGFHEYAHYFIGTKGNYFCTYPAETSCTGDFDPFQKLLNAILLFCAFCYCKLNLQLLDVRVFDLSSMGGFDGDFSLDDNKFISSRETSRILFVTGWKFRDERSIRKHAESVRRYFRPVDYHAANISRLVEKARRDCDLLVGIHIRQGDYRKWLGGKYYFGTSDYVNIITQAGELWKGKRIRYLICSNVKQDERLFKDLNYIRGTGDPLEDMYAFAACDYLIGPPSTYTMWASFYGSVPLLEVEALDMPLTLEEFKIC